LTEGGQHGAAAYKKKKECAFFQGEALNRRMTQVRGEKGNSKVRTTRATVAGREEKKSLQGRK